MNFIRRFLAATLLLFAATLPAHAQFANQATYAGAASGSVSAQAVTLPNMVSLADILGVPITWVPSAANTGAVTLAINSGSATAIQKPTGGGLAALSGAELQSGQPVMTMYNGTVHVLLSNSGSTPNNGILSRMLATSAVPVGSPMVNGTISVTVTSNAMTISLKTLAGANPSASDVLWANIAFNAAGVGNYVPVPLTSALSITVPAGASLGTVNGQANRIWIGFYQDGSNNPQLAVYNSLNASAPSIVSWNENAGATFTAITSGATSSQTWYGSAAATGRAFRIIGYVESTQTSAGTWASSPSFIQLFGPGVKKPGDAVQRSFQVSATAPSTTSTTFVALTGASISLTPSSAANLIRITGNGNLRGEGVGVLQLSRGTTAATNLLGAAVSVNNTGVTDGNDPAFMEVYDIPNTVVSQTYAIQGHTIAGSTTVVLGSDRTIGTLGFSMSLEEIQI